MANSIFVSAGISADWTTLMVFLASVPVIYYGYLGLAEVRRLGRILKVMKTFPGPERHWLYGNLHQVR